MRGLTEKQKALIMANYFAFDTRAELAFFVGCTIKQLLGYMNRMPVKDIYTKKEVKKVKPEKRRVVFLDPSKSVFQEPKFSARELQMFEDSLIEDTEKVGVRIEVINGQRCTVFQSRMNY